MDGRKLLPLGGSFTQHHGVRGLIAAIAVAVGLYAGTALGQATTQPAPAVAASEPAAIAKTPAIAPASQPAPAKPAVEAKAEAASDTDAASAAASPIEATPIHHSAGSDAKESPEKTRIAHPNASKLPSGVSNALQVGTALAVVVGLILIGKGLAKKYLPQAKAAGGKGVIEVLARYPLSKNQSLVLVRIGTQIVTLNQGKEASQSVLVINDPTEVARIMGQIEGQNPRSIQAGFSKLLANAQVDLENPENDPDRERFEEEPDSLDNQLEEMAAARRQLMELRQQVRSVRDSLAD